MLTPFRHELIELDLVLGKTEPVEEFAEFALFLFKPLHGLGLVFVEGAIAARWTGMAVAAMSETTAHMRNRTGRARPDDRAAKDRGGPGW
jgi:hypothetical protein